MNTKRCPKCSQVKSSVGFHLRPNGHLQSHCKLCDSKRAAAWAKANAERSTAHSAAYQERNRERINANARSARAQRPEVFRATVARWRASNVEKARAATLAWYVANPIAARAQEAKRRAMKLLAVAKWADHERIASIYASARELRNCGVDVHVDHIYPLQGRLVCGLHTHDNLQILLAKANIAKGNKSTEVI